MNGHLYYFPFFYYNYAAMNILVKRISELNKEDWMIRREVTFSLGKRSGQASWCTENLAGLDC